MRTALVALAVILGAGLAAAQPHALNRAFDVLHYDLDLRLPATLPPAQTDSVIHGSCTAFVRVLDDTMSTVFYHLRGLTVDSVFVGTQRAAFTRAGEFLTIDVPLPVPDTFTTRVVYHGVPQRDTAEGWGGWFWGDPTYVIGVGFVDSSISQTRYWMPCYDLPDDKATFTLRLTVPVRDTTRLAAAAAGPGGDVQIDSVTAGRGMATFTFTEQTPIATYLITWATGSYALLSGKTGGHPYRIYVPPSDSLAATNYFSFLDSAMFVYQVRYGPYPFAKVGYCLVPLAGGMEHQGMISLGEKFVHSASQRMTAAHELSHQWWGDCVSPQSFSEAWLSEGFATFSEAVFSEMMWNHAAFATSIHQKMEAYVGSLAAREGIFPLVDFPRTSPSSNYPATIYLKGASVLAMLRWVYGDSLFFASLLKYRLQHVNGGATSRDLRFAFEQVTGDTLGWFWDEWIYGAGWPILDVRVTVDDSIRLTVLQKRGQYHQPYRMPYDIGFVQATGDTDFRRVLIEAVDSQTISLPTTFVPLLGYVFDPFEHVLGQHFDSPLTSVEAPATRNDFPFYLETFPNPVHLGTTPSVHFPRPVSPGATLSLVDAVGRVVRSYTSSLRPYMTDLRLDVAGIPAGAYRCLYRANGLTSSSMVTVVR